MANTLWKTWKDLQKERIDSKVQTTAASLELYKIDSELPGESADIAFNYRRGNISGPGDNNPQQKKRIETARKFRAYCNLLINGQKVGTTRQGTLTYPSFEIDIGEYF